MSDSVTDSQPANGEEETPSTDPPGSQDASRTFTQADLDRIVADRIKRERDKYADYNDLKQSAQRLSELEDAQKTEAQRLTEAREAEQAARTAAEERAQQAELNLLKREVADQVGLPASLAARIQGGTAEELKADAEALLKTVAPAAPGRPGRPVEDLRPGAAPASGDGPADMNEWMRSRAPRTGN